MWFVYTLSSIFVGSNASRENIDRVDLSKSCRGRFCTSLEIEDRSLRRRTDNTSDLKKWFIDDDEEVDFARRLRSKEIEVFHIAKKR